MLEYRFLPILTSADTEGLDAFANDGWRVVASIVVPHGGTGDSMATLVLERERRSVKRSAVGFS